MAYDDILKDLALCKNFLYGIKKDVSSGQIRNYVNVLNGLKKLGEIFRSLEKILDKQDDKTIRKKCDYIKNLAKELQDIVSDSVYKPTSWIKVTNRLDELFGELDALSKLLAEKQEQIEPQEKDRQGVIRSKEQQKKITKLTDFIHNSCEETTSIPSKANRIHEFVKKGKIKFMPKPVNKTKGNQTKLYDEAELQQIWPKLKEKIKSLPNLKG